MTDKIDDDFKNYYRVNAIRHATTKADQPALVLQVNIEGQDQNVLLTLDEMKGHISNNQEVVDALDSIADSLYRIAHPSFPAILKHDWKEALRTYRSRGTGK